jgi:apolipoprotein N-acyltransferase
MGKRVAWLKLAAAVASGLLVAGLFPPFHLSALVWVAMVPLLVALWSVDGRRAGWKGFGLGWLAGTVSCWVQFRWLGVVSTLGVVVLPLYLGLFWGVFGAFAATLGNPWRERGSRNAEVGTEEKKRTLADSFRVPSSAFRDALASLRVAFCLAAVWAGLEWLRGWLFTGFGWNGLGVAFHETPVIAQAADLLGVTGLSMLPVFFQAVLVQTGRRMMASARDGKRRTRLDLLAAAGVIAALACYGILRMATEGRGETVRLKALLVQINIPQEAARQLWTAEEVHMAYEEETTKALEALYDRDQAKLKEAMDASDEGGIELSWPDWVIWPESALTGRILRAEDGTWGAWRENMETIARVRTPGRFHLIYGINELEAEKTSDGMLVQKSKGDIWNSIAVMSPEDDLQTYRKRHLVIFGETIPFVDTIPFLKMIYEKQAGIEYNGSYTPGKSVDPLPVATAGGTTLGVIPTVCFEDTVPRIPRLFVRPNAQIIVNVTNDGWFKESPAADQHFANARFRAIELRRPMVRSANTGVTAAVDSTGSTAHPDTGKPQVLMNEHGSHFTRGWMLAELDVPLKPSFSLYALIGDWGVIVVAVFGFGWVWLERRRAAL